MLVCTLSSTLVHKKYTFSEYVELVYLQSVQLSLTTVQTGFYRI
jgi:hypothetical protein